MHSCIKLLPKFTQKNIFFLTGLVTRKEDQKDNFTFCVNYKIFKFLYLILAVLFLFSNYL
jgi:hypothetical protein